jgi:hypothetical protein
MRDFQASFDVTTKVATAVACGVMVLIAALAHSVPVACVSILGALLAYAYSPQGYELSGRSIVVRRLLANVEVPLENVREARAATSDDLRGCLRLWGSGGMFGYYGLFRTSKLGKCTWYVTNRRNAVVVVTDSKTAVFSPDDVEGFLAGIRASAPVPETPGIAAQSTGQSRSWPLSIAAGVGAGMVIGGVAVAFAAFAMTYAPGPPACSLTGDTLTIQDRFYSLTLRAAAVDADRIRVVDLDEEPAWRPTARTNGFANGHYQSGHFRAANGAAIRLYRADGDRRLVLIPPRGEGDAVLLDALDPQAFAREIRARWSR